MPPKPKPFETPDLSKAAERALEEIRRLLATGITDWAVTDRETEEIHAHLEPLSRSDYLGVLFRLALAKEGGEPLLAKYIRRGVLDHSEKQRQAVSAQVAWKLYTLIEGGGPAAVEEARAIERELRALTGATLWDALRGEATGRRRPPRQ